jgi:SAM-dependent methyltransferase
VAAYDRKSGSDFQAEIESLVTLGLAADSTLVDLGCGTGGLAAAASPRCRRVVAVDVSPAMLTAAAARTACLQNVELVKAGFLTYNHSGDAPSIVYSRNALHHLPDFWKTMALGRMATMLAPGGVLVLRDLVFSFEPDAAHEAISRWLAAAPEDPAGGWTRSELETHLREEFSTYTWLLEPMIERAGLEITEVEHSESRIFARYVLSSARDRDVDE